MSQLKKLDAFLKDIIFEAEIFIKTVSGGTSIIQKNEDGGAY